MKEDNKNICLFYLTFKKRAVSSFFLSTYLNAI